MHWIARVKHTVSLVVVTPEAGDLVRRARNHLSQCDREEHGRGEGGGVYVVGRFGC